MVEDAEKEAGNHEAGDDVAADTDAQDAEAANSAPETTDKSAQRADSESWLEQWQELGAKMPKPWLKKIQKRRDNAMSLLARQDSPFSDKNNDARRLHCIKLEILRDVETPAEDKAKRMQYQLCLLYTSPSPRDRTRSRMPSSA